MRLSILAVLIASALMAACSTVPVPIGEAIPADESRVLAFKTPPATPHGTMVVLRDLGFLGGGCYYALSVNGQLATRLSPGEMAKLYVPTGELVLRAGRDPLGKGLCALDGENWTQRETSLKDGEAKSFRLSIDTSGKIDVHRADTASDSSMKR